MQVLVLLVGVNVWLLVMNPRAGALMAAVLLFRWALYTIRHEMGNERKS